jgi:uncharacterized protein YecE (DUF72 family)
MYRLGRALGNMLGRLHANQIFYNDTILSDPSGRSHLLVSSNGDCRLIDFGVSLLLDRHPQLSREEVYNFVRTLPVFPILSGMGTDSDEMGQFLDQYQQRLTYASKAEIIARDLRFTREGLRLAARFMGSHIIDPFQQGFGETYKLTKDDRRRTKILFTTERAEATEQKYLCVLCGEYLFFVHRIKPMTSTIYYIGTSGFSYSHWRGVFYPEKLPQARWLEHYARQFPTVEVNNSFYRLPSEKTFQGWRERTPAGFLFAVKASRFITHLRRLHDVQEPLETFLSRARNLKEKLGPVLYQLPPSMGQDKGLLEAFLSLLPEDLQYVIEFRRQNWYEEKVYAGMRRYNVALCIHDMSQSESPTAATADFAYVRFHGTTGRYAGNYSNEQLEDWANRIRQLASRNNLKTVHIYFNNDIEGHAVNNARALAQLLAQGTDL